MEAIQAIFNIVAVVFIVSTMLAAGLGITFEMLGELLKNVWLWVLVLAANVAVVPLLGWGVATAFGLTTAASIAFILFASSPGGPFGAKLAMIQKGDVVAGASLQVLLAAVGSVTFAIVANLVLGWANLGSDISLNVGKLVGTVVVLQLVPFAVGLLMRYLTPDTSDEWLPTTLKTSNFSLLVVLAMMLFGSWQQIVDLIGSWTIIAAIVFALLATGIGWLMSVGPETTRTTTGTLAPIRNAGPVLAAIAISFNNEPDILAATVALVVFGNIVPVLVAGYLGKRRSAAVTSATAPSPHETALADDARQQTKTPVHSG